MSSVDAAEIRTNPEKSPTHHEKGDLKKLFKAAVCKNKIIHKIQVRVESREMSLHSEV